MNTSYNVIETVIRANLYSNHEIRGGFFGTIYRGIVSFKRDDATANQIAAKLQQQTFQVWAFCYRYAT